MQNGTVVVTGGTLSAVFTDKGPKKNISGTVSGQDKEVIGSGLAEYQNEIPELTLGMYVDISILNDLDNEKEN